MKITKSLTAAIRTADVDIESVRSYGVRNPTIRLRNANNLGYRAASAIVHVIAAELEVALIGGRDPWPVVVDTDGDRLHLELMHDTDAEHTRAMDLLRKTANALGI